MPRARSTDSWTPHDIWMSLVMAVAGGLITTYFDGETWSDPAPAADVIGREQWLTCTGQGTLLIGAALTGLSTMTLRRRAKKVKAA